MPEHSLIANRSRVGRGRPQEGRRVLDLAEGILIGLRRYSAAAAFDELVAVAYRHDISMSAAASALVDLAIGDAEAANHAPLQAAIAQLEWGDLLLTAGASEHRG
jgi:ANTAR domain